MSQLYKNYSITLVNSEKSILSKKYLNNSYIGNDTTQATVKSALQQFNKKNLISLANSTAPFCFRESRFQWQDNTKNKSRVQSVEMLHSKTVRSQKRNCLDGGFEFFNDVSRKLHYENRKASVKLNSSTQRKICENKNSGRVINPKLDREKTSKSTNFNKLKQDNIINLSTTNINNLNKKENTAKNFKKLGKKVFEFSYNMNSCLFSEEYNNMEPFKPPKKRVMVDNPLSNTYIRANSVQDFRNHRELSMSYKTFKTVVKNNNEQENLNKNTNRNRNSSMKFKTTLSLAKEKIMNSPFNSNLNKTESNHIHYNKLQNKVNNFTQRSKSSNNIN